MLDAKVVGSVLQRLREERGLSQEIVSGLAGIGRTHLSAIERGERKPTLETFYRIGEALHMRPSAVLAEIEAGAGVPAPTAAPAKTREPTYDLLDSLRESEADAVAEKLREVNLDTLTPLEAMNLLFTLKKMLSCS